MNHLLQIVYWIHSITSTKTESFRQHQPGPEARATCQSKKQFPFQKMQNAMAIG